MKAAQSIELMAAPLASLFLILSLLAACFKPPSTGEFLMLSTYWGKPQCGDGRPLFFVLEPNHFAKVNGQHLPVKAAVSYVLTEMQSRAERVVIISATADTSIGDLEAVMTRLRTSSDSLHFLSFTDSQQRPLGYPRFDLDCLTAKNWDVLVP